MVMIRFQEEIKNRIFPEIKNEILKVEEELYRETQSFDEPFFRQSALYLLEGGGKRLRPSLVILGGKFYDYSFERLKSLAVSVEMMHMATLVHDDIIDHAQMRRKRPTVNALKGKEFSLALGDYLFGRSLLLATKCRHPRVLDLFALLSKEMCRGEIQQNLTAFDYKQNVRHYLYRIKRKTAFLISVSCQVGALLSSAPLQAVKALASYGYNLGMAFQLRDDILDFKADAQELGKPVANDLKEGIFTLPVIVALKMSPFNERLIELLRKNEKDEKELKEIVNLIWECGALEYAENVAARYEQKALKSLELLPAGSVRENLERIAFFVTHRNF